MEKADIVAVYLLTLGIYKYNSEHFWQLVKSSDSKMVLNQIIKRRLAFPRKDTAIKIEKKAYSPG